MRHKHCARTIYKQLIKFCTPSDPHEIKEHHRFNMSYKRRPVARNGVDSEWRSRSFLLSGFFPGRLVSSSTDWFMCLLFMLICLICLLILVLVCQSSLLILVLVCQSTFIVYI